MITEAHLEKLLNKAASLGPKALVQFSDWMDGCAASSAKLGRDASDHHRETGLYIFREDMDRHAADEALYRKFSGIAFSQANVIERHAA